jgi:hypothetical protein
VRPGIVHRLDKGTSGLLVVAKVQIIVLAKRYCLVCPDPKQSIIVLAFSLNNEVANICHTK